MSAAPSDPFRRYALEQGLAEIDLPRSDPEPWRRLALQGNYNFRDVGGYPTGSGATVARGLVWRTDHLAELTEDDRSAVRALGLRRVHDFRLDSEVERQPSRWPENPAPTVLRLAIGDADGSEAAIDVVRDMLAGKRPLPEPTFWDDNYVDMLERGAPMFVRFFESLVSDDALPAVHHCTGGKDRTGLSTAMLHTLLGVDRETAIDDFLLTNLYRTPYRVEALRDGLAQVGVDVLAAIPVIGVTRSAIERAFEVLDATAGGTEGYLLGAGMDPSVPDRLRSALLR